MELKEIKRKISSVSNIRELTSALETLSALKMKKAQKIALLSRPFSRKVGQLLGLISGRTRDSNSLFFKEKDSGDILVCVVASDRGFCGLFNQNILRFTEKEIREIEKTGAIDTILIGKRAISYFTRRKHPGIITLSGIGDYGELEEIKPVSDALVKNYLGGKYRKVYLFYTEFLSTFVQKPKMIQLLPIRKEDLENFLKNSDSEETSQGNIDFTIEPSDSILADEIVPQLIEYLIYQCILESNAAEHSARMLAMRNAADNAQKITASLRLEYNKARQEQITAEVCEISSTKEALG